MEPVSELCTHQLTYTGGKTHSICTNRAKYAQYVPPNRAAARYGREMEPFVCNRPGPALTETEN